MESYYYSPPRDGLVYLVTGGCGFLGEHIVKMLLERESRLKELRILDIEYKDWLNELVFKFRSVEIVFIKASITDNDIVLNATAGVDLIIHTACIVDVFGKFSDRQIMEVNVTGTKNLLEACITNGVGYFIFTSSMEAVGPNTDREPFIGDEDTAYTVKHPHVYSRSKAEAEKLVLSYNGRAVCGGRFMTTAAIRPTGVYGEGDALTMKSFHQAKKLRNKMYRTISPTVEHSRVYVGNAAWMHVLLAKQMPYKSKIVGGQVYYTYDNSPTGLSYEDFNLLFFKFFGVKLVGETKPVIPHNMLKALAYVNKGIQTCLKPFCKFTPMLNPATLAIATTTFAVKTNKANEHFGYRAVYCWEASQLRTIKWIFNTELLEV
ncbi:3 beta-hydroxysteroid dehydrogenase/delta 5-_4 isomerase [Pteropox virus]|uniref:3 beta-hydroxysteroid dehydrogenase/Delta 5-->4-isomerase n=1 Tax=Pteropox virus TaxID=1873698 RepID=A0A1B1MRD1_9POXV|nr:nucleotide-sugar epimerase [Pteropox virus]ANS71122.1 3 beta-hydroxysteroid dehydrogenase/delta 5->4 isomerase [Pteropox virus]